MNTATISLKMSEEGMIYLNVHPGPNSWLNLIKFTATIEQNNRDHGALEAKQEPTDNPTHYHWMINKKLHRCFNSMAGPEEKNNLDPDYLKEYLADNYLDSAGFTLFEGVEAIVKALPEGTHIVLADDFFDKLEKIVKNTLSRHALHVETLEHTVKDLLPIDIDPYRDEPLPDNTLQQIENIYELIKTKEKLIQIYIRERHPNCFRKHDVDDNADSVLNNTIANIGDIRKLCPFLHEHHIEIPKRGMPSIFSADEAFFTNCGLSEIAPDSGAASTKHSNERSLNTDMMGSEKEDDKVSTCLTYFSAHKDTYIGAMNAAINACHTGYVWTGKTNKLKRLQQLKTAFEKEPDEDTFKNFLSTAAQGRGMLWTADYAHTRSITAFYNTLAAADRSHICKLITPAEPSLLAENLELLFFRQKVATLRNDTTGSFRQPNRF